MEQQVVTMGTKDIHNNLIINYLPQFISEEEFKSMFLSIGPLISSKIVRDKTTGFSYGFGFVEYETDLDADRAVRVFDGLQLHSKRIRVQHANKGDETHKGYNIYVKHIPSDFTETELDALFEPYGKIVTSKVLIDLQTGQSRNVGFVLYETKSEADKAIGELNGKILPGQSVGLQLKYADDASKKSVKTPIQPMVPHVQPHGPAPYSATFPAQASPNNGFNTPTPPGPMRNNSGNRFRFNPLSRDNTNNSFGNTNSFGLGVGGSGGYGGSMNQNSYNQGSGFGSGMTSPMSSGMASPQMEIPQGPPPYSIFVFNIGDDAEERELWALFSPFGTVQKCTVMMDPEKKVCKGYGFVDMANAIEAANAIKNLNGYYYKGRQLNVSFKSKKREQS